VVIKSALKRWIKNLCWRPPGAVRSGTESYLIRPRRIDGAQFIQIGSRSTIDGYSWLSAVQNYGGQHYTPSIVIGNDVHIGRYACITSISHISVGDGCLFSEYVYISDLSHGTNPDNGLLVDQPLVSKGEVRIGAHTFLGYRVCIMPGVKLGRHCIVGANSVVTRSFPEYSMIAGCPARLIKTYSRETQKWISIPEVKQE
jgi:acetyltransferase-like isoleucine patch superfamily enzyme